MHKPVTRFRASGVVCAAAAAAGLAAVALPALAQPTVGEVVVIAPQGDSLSEPVSYADLDLTTTTGRAVLHERIREAAADVCYRLQTDDRTGSSVAPGCVSDAVDRARDQERRAYAQAENQAYAYAPPPPPAYVPPPPAADETAPAVSAYGEPAAATVTTETVTNNPVPDTAQNRARYGGPMSNGGRMTTPAGN